ncbi:MAG: trypsin-like peptidase domain-containing protein, partial [Deltaproteobacteria bacterium]|nr:trypsin-like peptidase domain-containing protein [Deltaproteobacteria bacterium]
RGHYQRQDLFVIIFALVIILVAGRFHGKLTTPQTTMFPPTNVDGRGLTFEHAAGWLHEPLSLPAPRLLRDPQGRPPRSDALHLAFTPFPEGNARIEVLIDKKPPWSNVTTSLDLDRRTRYGELYKLVDSSVRSIADQNWLRTEYTYAHASHKDDLPRVDRAVEYAIVDSKQLYVITLFGSLPQIERLENVVAPSLRVQSRSGLPFQPQARSIGVRQYPPAVGRAFSSAVMVIVADLVDGRLQARGGGAGVIVGTDGSILTNYHVVHDKDGRLHDLFIIGRFDKELDRMPKLTCAGRPNRGKLQREIDLALIKCDTDLDGRTWVPSTSTEPWAILPEARNEDVSVSQRLWVLGYPDVVGGGLTLSEGEVEGWSGTDGAQGRDFIKTDASITHGNSGGPVVNDKGQLVGIASASRTRIMASGTVLESAHVGLVRPLLSATDLLAIAATGWTPREGRTDPEMQPTIEPRAEGIRIATVVVDAANGAKVRDALVMVMRPDVAAEDIDVNRLDDQVLAWGRSNTEGDVQLKQPVPVPGTYTVMVVARGYEALVKDGVLRLGADAPPSYDPWGKIELRSR